MCCVARLCGSYVEMQLVGPLTDHLVLCYRLVIDLVLEDVIASGGVAVLVESDRCPGTSC